MHHLLSEVSALHTELQQALPKIYDTQATQLQLSIINYLAEYPQQTVPKIAAFKKSSRQNIQVIINELLTLGIVTKKPNIQHKKSLIFELSSVGHAMHKQYQDAYLDFLDKLSLNITDEEMESSLSMLKKIKQIF